MKTNSNKKVFIIAEAGVNHNGDLGIAKKLIDVAKQAGADAVKFQTFKSGNIVTKSAQKAGYQKRLTAKNESQFDMIRRLELDVDAHKQLIGYCRKKNIAFLSSPFDEESIELLDRLGIKTFKIPSGEITNLPYLKKIGRLRKKVIMSTGMADLGEVRSALKILIDAGTPKENITVLHCTTAYPAPVEDANLLAMLTMKDIFKIKAGYSDHTLGIEAPIAAAALGASVIEKHFTLDRKMKGPDHRASLEPAELCAMVKAIRNIEKALGDGTKRSLASEAKNKGIARKSIVAARNISKGEIFTEENIAVKRPAAGISPMEWDRVIGKVAKRNFKEEEPIKA